MLKRLGEELSGQKEKEQVARHAKSSGEEMIDDEDEKFAIEPPFAQASTGNDDVRPITTNQQGKSEHPTPTSIPILLHLVGQLVGDVMSRAMKRVGDKASLGDRVERGPIEEDEPEQGRKPRRVRSVVTSENRLYEAWTTKSSSKLSFHSSGSRMADSDTDGTESSSQSISRDNRSTNPIKSSLPPANSRHKMVVRSRCSTSISSAERNSQSQSSLRGRKVSRRDT